MSCWSQLGVPTWLSKKLHLISLVQPTDIQTQLIPQILKGKDIIGSAATGSGKTLAFALPILSKLAIDPYGVYALVLTPTRELAIQIAEQFRIIGTEINLKVSIVVGGLDMMSQALEMSKKPHIVIATPGRLVDHIKSSTNAIYFKRIKFLVLDEADRLLEQSFQNDLETISGILPKVGLQTILISATINKTVKEYHGAKDPFVFISKSKVYDTVEKLDQRYLFIPSVVREAYLVYILLHDFAAKSVIVFATRPKMCETLRLILGQFEVESTALHSYMSQSERIASLARFKSGTRKILICTDIGSRGLDIPTVEVVINYQLAANPADYVHRVGRTARAGRSGVSLSIVTERDIDIVQAIEEKIGKQMVEYTVPENPVLETLEAVNMAKRVAGIELTENQFGVKEMIRKEKHTNKHDNADRKNKHDNADRKISLGVGKKKKVKMMINQ